MRLRLIKPDAILLYVICTSFQVVCMYDMYMTDTIENLSLDRNSLSFIARACLVEAFVVGLLMYFASGPQ
jgi:hypothetical protein